MVGLHHQLSTCSIHRHSGIDVSLFKLLSEEHPSAIVSLRHQYRMHKDIMYLANDLIYGHRMQCGAKATATGLLQLPKFAEVKERYRHTATGFVLQSHSNVTSRFLRIFHFFFHEISPYFSVFFLEISPYFAAFFPEISPYFPAFFS